MSDFLIFKDYFNKCRLCFNLIDQENESTSIDEIERKFHDLTQIKVCIFKDFDAF